MTVCFNNLDIYNGLVYVYPNHGGGHAMRRLTKEPWFGPKTTIGWGLSPKNRQGWAVTTLFLLGIFIDAILLAPSQPVASIITSIVLLLAFIAVVFISSDKPGGPGL